MAEYFIGLLNPLHDGWLLLCSNVTCLSCKVNNAVRSSIRKDVVQKKEPWKTKIQRDTFKKRGELKKSLQKCFSKEQ